MSKLQLNYWQKKVLEFVKEQHGNQVRKYTNEPYWTHCTNVMQLLFDNIAAVEDGDPQWLIEIALCHDLYEDTGCNSIYLHSVLTDIGYNLSLANYITQSVAHLTHIYTPEFAPDMNRRMRKIRESDRYIPPYCETVKYADMIDNSLSIIMHDPGFAKIYIPEKEYFLEKHQSGDRGLYDKCWQIINNYKQKQGAL